MFENLKNDTLTIKQIKTIESLKEFSITRKRDLEKANDLLFDFYYANNMIAVKKMLDVMTTIKFNGDFNFWTFVQPSYCLKYFLSSNENNKKEITEMLYNDVKSSLDTKEEHLEFLLEIQNGRLLESAQTKLLKNMDNENDEYVWRSNLIKKYLHILALGTKGIISSETVLLEINKNINRQKELYKIINKTE